MTTLQINRRQTLLNNLWVWALLLSLAFFLSGCDTLLGTELPTLIPAEYLPTAIAQTSEAGKTTMPTATSTVELTPTPTLPEPPTQTPEPSLTPTNTEIPTEIITTLPPPPAENPPIVIPYAEIQIRNLGKLSRLASPIPINSFLRPGYGNQVLIELRGEDKRVLAREITVLPYTDRYGRALLYMKLDFQISATAEAGRLVFSTADQFGRTVTLNSVPLILLSIGESDIVPPVDTLETIVILQPTPKIMIQGGILLLQGLIRPSSDQYLMAQLIAEDGRVVGKRVTSVPLPLEGGYATFTVDIPYSVTEATPARLVVWEGEANLADVIHLSSVEVLLSP